MPEDNDIEEKVIINEKYPDQRVTLEKHLPPPEKNHLVQLLANNPEVFAWTSANITRILRELAEHNMVTTADTRVKTISESYYCQYKEVTAAQVEVSAP
uniref:Reverse transcriptase domain-containing protein n=1 Tax=Tanacetum cinerariifolium TaxID=118510 RepID=A0A6L2LLK9_TANCI|nr:hypothetical protein [Tanacetum cinerariifolium]